MNSSATGRQREARRWRPQARHEQGRTTWMAGSGGCRACKQRVLHAVGPAHQREQHPEIVAAVAVLYRAGAGGDVASALERGGRERRTGTTACPVCGHQTLEALVAIRLHVIHPDQRIQTALHTRRR